MKQLRLSSIFFFILAFTFCNQGTKNANLSSCNNDTISCKKVFFEYDDKMLKSILLPGTMNDSISLSFLFDTGMMGVTVSDSMKRVLGDSILVSIGTWKHNPKEKIRQLRKAHNFYKIFGDNFSAIGWEIFRDKIIKVSYKNKYIEELSSFETTKDYDCIKMKLDEESNFYLSILVQVSVQGKCITEYLTVDTGFNGYVHFSNSMVNMHNIDTDHAYNGITSALNGFEQGCSLIADSIKIGSHTITNKNIAFSLDPSHKMPSKGLLGNALLENFDVIFDFKNGYLYLKRNV